MTSPRILTVPLGAEPFCVYDWPAHDAGAALPPVVFLHATSFHARIWDQTIRHLRGLQPGRRCLALDLRGHGRSAKSMPANPWPRARTDVVNVLEALGVRGALGVGHSFGGHAAIRAAAARPGLFDALVLVDPTVFPRPAYGGWSMPETMLAVTRKRRNQWASSVEMFERFVSRLPFNRWRPEVLRDYCEAALEADPDGGLRLACSPETEARIYATGSLAENGAVYDDVAALDLPVRVVRCAMTRGTADPARIMLTSPTAPGLAADFRHAEDIVLEDTSHFIPMEVPGKVAALIASWPPGSATIGPA
ncbi:MAG: alpha/beta hydrolase [Thermoflexales bacterium]|nr:alpha/beta hydrolase [Thermoflexales bacterium]